MKISPTRSKRLSLSLPGALLFLHFAQSGPNAAPAPAPAPASPVGTNQVAITIEVEQRVIRANGLPDHAAGHFPNRGNPHRIAAQSHVFRVPLKPLVSTNTTPMRMHPFGVAVNGVVFDPGAAEWWNNDRAAGWQYEPMTGPIKLGLDDNFAHVQPNGAYHYHGPPTGLLAQLTGGKSKLVLVGWAADGFPIYGAWGLSDAKDAKSELKKLKSSYRLKNGTRPSGPGGKYDGSFVQDFEFVAGAGDLDVCNGRVGVTPEFPAGTYHYVVTEDFPFIPRLFRGTPDASFFRKGPPGGFGGPGGPGGPGGRRPGFGPPPFGPPPGGPPPR